MSETTLNKGMRTEQQHSVSCSGGTGVMRDYSLEQLLDELQKYGKPRLSYMGNGWHCCVEMYVCAKGVEFEVKSDFKHKTHKDAAIECCERTLKALSELAA